jgi:hypothetical protein
MQTKTIEFKVPSETQSGTTAVGVHLLFSSHMNVFNGLLSVNLHTYKLQVKIYVADEKNNRHTPETRIASGKALKSVVSLVTRQAVEGSVSRRLQFPIDAWSGLHSHLEVARGLVSVFVGSNNSDILKSANGNGGPLRDESESDVAGGVRHVHSASGIVEVDHIAILLVYQLNHIALGTAE